MNVRYQDMLIETPYPLANVADRRVRSGNEDSGHCTYCGVQNGDEWHPIAELTVYRIWTADSVYRPDAVGVHEQGGKWQWRCSEHPKRSWSPWSHLAPEELQPPERNPCEEVDRLSKRKCGTTEGARRFEEGWYCPEHSLQHELRDRELRVLRHEDPEAGERGEL